MVEPPSRYFNTERHERQDAADTDTTENLISPLLIFTAVLGFQLGSLLIGQSLDKVDIKFDNFFVKRTTMENWKMTPSVVW